MCMEASPMFRSWAAYIPVVMSLTALALVLFHIATVGTAPQADEGTEAHLFQLLIAGQVPIVIFYGLRWLPRNPRTALLVMGVQFVAGASALAPVYLLHW